MGSLPLRILGARDLGRHWIFSRGFCENLRTTKAVRYTSYAQICVYMDISKDLPKAISLTWNDEDWLQMLDYKYIPFRSCRCHEHGYLSRDFPLNIPQCNLFFFYNYLTISYL